MNDTRFFEDLSYINCCISGDLIMKVSAVNVADIWENYLRFMRIGIGMYETFQREAFIASEAWASEALKPECLKHVDKLSL